MTEINVQDLARTLEKTAAGLDRHIATEAQKRATKLGAQYAKAADERIRDNQAEMQRAQDLVAELRRQMRVLEQRSAAYAELESHLKDIGNNADKCGTDVPVKALMDAVRAGRAAGHAEWQRQQKEKAERSTTEGGH